MQTAVYMKKSYSPPRDETEEEAAAIDRQIEEALRSMAPPTRKEIKRRQSMYATSRARTEQRYHLSKNEEERKMLREALAYTASEMHVLSELEAATAPPSAKEAKLAKRANQMFHSSGLLLRMVGAIQMFNMNTMTLTLKYELNSKEGMSATYIRDGLKVDTFRTGLGLLFDPTKVRVEAAFEQDAWTEKDEEDYAPLYEPRTEKSRREFVGSMGPRIVTDYARYPSKKFEGRPWSVSFPAHSMAAMSYKSSKFPEYAEKFVKSYNVYNEVVIKAKPGSSLADAIVGVVYVPRDWSGVAIDWESSDNPSIFQKIVQTLKFEFHKDLPILKYEKYALTYLPARYFTYFWSDKIVGARPQEMTKAQYEARHAGNSDLSKLVQDGFAVGFLYDYNDGGFLPSDDLASTYIYQTMAVLSSSADSPSMLTQILAGVLAAQTYLGISYEESVVTSPPDETYTSAKFLFFALNDVVYQVPTYSVRIRLPQWMPGGNFGVYNLVRHIHGDDADLRMNGHNLPFLVDFFRYVAQPFVKPGVRPRPDLMFFPIASENPNWRKASSPKSLGGRMRRKNAR